MTDLSTGAFAARDSAARDLAPGGPDASRTFSLTRDDLVEANRHALAVNLRKPRLRLVLAAAASVFLAIGFLQEGVQGVIAWLLILVLAGTLGPFALRRFVIPRQVRRLLRIDPRFSHPWRAAFEPAGLYVETSQGEMRYRWHAFKGRLASPNVLMLMLGPSVFVPLPLRALVPGDAAAIDGHLSAAGVPLDPAGDVVSRSPPG